MGIAFVALGAKYNRVKSERKLTRTKKVINVPEDITANNEMISLEPASQCTNIGKLVKD